MHPLVRVVGRRSLDLRLVDLDLGSSLEFLLDLLAPDIVAEIDVVVGAEIGVDHVAIPEISTAVPSAMMRPPAITTTQSLISWTMSMSCSTNSTVRPSALSSLT